MSHYLHEQSCYFRGRVLTRTKISRIDKRFGSIHILYLLSLSEDIFPLSDNVRLSLSTLRCHEARIMRIMCVAVPCAKA